MTSLLETISNDNIFEETFIKKAYKANSLFPVQQPNPSLFVPSLRCFYVRWVVNNKL